MNSPSPLGTLCNLAQKALDQAAAQLGQVRQSHQSAEQQLTMLLGYQDEYRQKLNHTLGGGIDALSWQNYQQFIQTLDKAIEQHRQQLTLWSQRLEQALRHWQEKQQRLNAFQTLADRALTQQRMQEGRLDQKRMDEFAQRSAHRKRET
ncbi:flagellar export protein FliJ [Nissabacter sp. SGAir0207]|uniref:flagellar export protein FliJ n=1 Tax=Nissabacter sp. SGAir0207 TaxID=2126321 RepID=UPI0010CD3272|nr:flagellar export protein FliJ [Nissabacter sp. SGAir0207]QCR35825.1 flagellar biosynthesis chaperone FliJ [Nissabacter sp. SGAir0207]